MTYMQSIVLRKSGDHYVVVKDLNAATEAWLASFAEEHAAIAWAEEEAASEDLPLIDEISS